jgi:hypothetical protein
VGRWLGLVLLVALASAQPAVAQWADGAEGADWLDAPLVVWNVAGASVPPARREMPRDPLCERTVRAPETTGARQVAQQGWTVDGPSRTALDLELVLGANGEDGMCRPMGFNLFVFVVGRYAGTLSPVLMDSRMDGVIGEIELLGTGAGHLEPRIRATFRRYAATDPLCCPSGPDGVVEYAIPAGIDGPVVVPLSRP